MKELFLILFGSVILFSCVHELNRETENETKVNKKSGESISDNQINVTDNIIYTKKDKQIFRKFTSSYDHRLSDYRGDELIMIAEQFIGKPYTPKTLEISSNEKLIINLREFDCTTYLENMIALLMNMANQDKNFEAFASKIQLLRYRDGEINQYPSRLHYFSDWIYDNEKKGIISDITQSIGGIPYKNDVNFMSRHKKAYKQLSDTTFLEEIKNREQNISKRRYFYIPEDSLKRSIQYIKQGDIIAFTTDIKGLDISHVGFAIYKNNRIHLLHASTGSNCVTISELTLIEYIKKISRHTGIMVLRLKN
jgi:hypothetical protein